MYRPQRGDPASGLGARRGSWAALGSSSSGGVSLQMKCTSVCGERGDWPSGSHKLLSRLSLSFLINFAWQMSLRFPEPGQVSNKYQPVNCGLDRPCNKFLLEMNRGTWAMDQAGTPSPSPGHGPHPSSQLPVVGPRSPPRAFGRSPHPTTKQREEQGLAGPVQGASH